MSRRFGAAFGAPLTASIAGHVVIIGLLILFVGQAAPLMLPPPKPAIEIVLAPPPPEPPAPAVAEPPPPEPPPPVVKAEPPPPVKEEPPPPPHPRAKPVVTRPPPVHRPPPEPRPIPYRAPMPVPPPSVPYRPPLAASPPPQTAAIPRPAPPAAPPPGPLVSAGYRAALGAWLESHKRYPESARERGEAGQAVLRFHVERSGRVLSYSIVRSTGYPDLDAAIEQMMRGAALPPFPADMTASNIEVSVTIRFALAR